MNQNHRRAGVVAVVAAVVSLLTIAPSRAASTGGFNDFACTPSIEHPNPVVLIHGFGSPGGDSNFRTIGPKLAEAGYCAFAVSYGYTAPLRVFGGLAPLDESAAFIRGYIDQVLAATGASQADLVGHSEGGLHALYIPKKYQLGVPPPRSRPGRGRPAVPSPMIGTVVAMAPPTHGIELGGVADVLRDTGLPAQFTPVTDLFGCAACDELVISESFIDKLNDGPIAQPGIAYTVIASRFDLLVHPTETSFVREPGVTNIEVQDVCPLNVSGHIGLAYDDAVFQMITNALSPANAAAVDCGVGGPPI